MAPTPLAQIQSLEKSLTATPSDPNPLLPLLALGRNSSPEVVHKAIWALYRVFIAFQSQGRIAGITGDGKGAKRLDEDASGGQGVKEVKSWVRDRFIEYIDVLAGLLRDTEPSLRTSALSLLFALIAPLSTSVPVHLPYFRLILRHLLAPTESLRGARPARSKAVPSTSSMSSSDDSRWIIVAAHQVELERGVLPPDVVTAVVDDYWAKYDDLRLFFFREAAQYLATNTIDHSSNLIAQFVPLTNLPKVPADLNTFFLPSLAEPPAAEIVSKRAKLAKSAKGKKTSREVEELPSWMETYESEESGDEDTVGSKRIRTTALGTHAAVHSIPAHVGAYTSLWESVLAHIPLDPQWTRRILAGLHGERGILAHMKPERRVRIADWLGATVDAGGPMAMLAMNGLFVLMTQYNLDYPNFYTRLYGLLDADVLHVKYRARFFRLLDTFLRSTLLPAALIASFIKRLARLCLSAPPAGIILVIPFVYNLFKRHPGCMVMLQRLTNDDDTSDPYDPLQSTPLTTRAIDSSVWELAALQKHYLASISTLAKIYAEQFTKPEFNLEDFLDHGYGTLFETEITRKLKNPPALAVALELGEHETALFPASNDTAERDVVGELWTF